jgi:hypothetical protein
VPAYPVVNDPTDYRVSFRMGDDGRIDREIPSRLLLVAYGGVPPPGAAPESPFDVGAAIDAATDANPPVIPPNTGTGEGPRSSATVVVIAVLALFAGATLIEIARCVNDRSRRQR